MTSTDQPEQRLKSDARGRVRTPRARREQILDEFERSGISGAEFARLIGVKYPTFANWVQQRRRSRGGDALLAAGAAIGHRPMQWVEAVVAPACPAQADEGDGLRLDLPGGARLQLDDRRQVALAAALLRALAGEGVRC